MVCDAIMGSGKSTAVIHHMNSNPDARYIYITPFLEEASRIKHACEPLKFVEPSDKLPEYDFNKYNHLVQLLKDGRNVASTHQMFRHFKNDILDLIRDGHYTLVIDEAVDVFQELVLKKSDLDIVTMMGWVDKNGEASITQDTPAYQGERFRDVFDLAQNGNFAIVNSNGDTYYWVMLRGFFDAFEDVYILTYLFPAQTLKYYFDMNGIEFTYIGIEHPEKGVYRFSSDDFYIPDYVGTLSKKIHIFDSKKMNAIGNLETALSCNWFARRKNPENPDMEALRCNVKNFFINYMGDHDSELRLWSTYKEYVGCIRGKGFYKSCLAYNSKATNAFKDRRVLAYCVNIFMKPDEKRYFLAHNVDVLEEEAALSTMIQWIWRSAIRDGEEIWIYIPSKRMRELLINWIARVEKQYAEYTQKGSVVNT